MQAKSMVSKLFSAKWSNILIFFNVFINLYFFTAFARTCQTRAYRNDPPHLHHPARWGFKKIYQINV